MEIKGFTYGFYAKRGQYRSEKGKYSQERLFETGINWMCLGFTVEQKQVFSTEIGFDYSWNCSDRDIMDVIKRSHERGVKVCMKPILNCADGVWRACINFVDTNMGEKDVYWDKWFESYGNFMKYYAELAEETGCEMLCIGCEMCGTERKETHWRKLISEIREIYHGKLMYNTNHGHENDVKWFDAVDYIGTSAYFRVAKEGGASMESMKAAWEKVCDSMKSIHEKFGKPVVFAEIGCRSARGCATMPWDFNHKDLPRDEDEQANFYESCLQVFADKPWFAGFFWWDWSTYIYETDEEAGKDVGFNIHRKKAEKVLKDWYSRL